MICLAKVRNQIWVERKCYDFVVNVEYENMSPFCSHSRSFSSCKLLVKSDKEKVVPQEKLKLMVSKYIHGENDSLANIKLISCNCYSRGLWVQLI